MLNFKRWAIQNRSATSPLQTPHRSTLLRLRVLAALLIASPILAACEHLTNTVGADTSHAIACSADPPIIWTPGDDAALLDILTRLSTGELKPAAVVPDVRTAAGDTDASIAQMKDHNAAYDAVCPAFIVPMPKPPDAAGLKPAVAP